MEEVGGLYKMDFKEKVLYAYLRKIDPALALSPSRSLVLQGIVSTV
jgi:hypothetical protein